MRKRLTTIALGSLIACIAVVPGALGNNGHGPKGPKGPKQAPGSVSLAASPSTVTPTTSTISVNGNVRATSGCRKDRTVQFSYLGSGGTTALPITAATGPNGDFTATLPRPTDAAPATVTLQATAGQADRKVGSAKKGKKSKKGRKITCLSGTGQTTLTVVP
jgi:hypothetical protein